MEAGIRKDPDGLVLSHRHFHSVFCQLDNKPRARRGQPKRCDPDTLPVDNSGRKRGSMEIWKNKASGKWFIYIMDTGSEEALFVTPPNENGEVSIKSLQMNFFDENTKDDETETLLTKGMITEGQLKRFNLYRKDRVGEEVEKVVDVIKHWAPSEKEKLIQELKAIAKSNTPEN